MKRATRIVAILLLGFLLPLQGFAAACAQICAARQATAAHEAAMQDEGASAPDHCGKSDMGVGKCCKAHAFMIDVAVPHVEGTPPFHVHAAPAARWTSYFPEEPSPPPILPGGC